MENEKKGRAIVAMDLKTPLVLKGGKVGQTTGVSQFSLVPPRIMNRSLATVASQAGLPPIVLSVRRQAVLASFPR